MAGYLTERKSSWAFPDNPGKNCFIGGRLPPLKIVYGTFQMLELIIGGSMGQFVLFPKIVNNSMVFTFWILSFVRNVHVISSLKVLKKQQYPDPAFFSYSSSNFFKGHFPYDATRLLSYWEKEVYKYMFFMISFNYLSWSLLKIMILNQRRVFLMWNNV